MADSTAEPAKSEPIEIILTFAETEEDEWPDEVSQQLADAEQVGSNGIRSVTLRVTSSFDPVSNNFTTDHDFLDLSGNPLIKAKNPRLLINLQQLVPAFYLASLRDAAQEFRTKSPFWGPFVRALELDDQARVELETALHDLNQKILEQHKAFGHIREQLKKTAELLPLDDTDPVSIEAVPSKVFDILSRTQVKLTSKTGAQIPIIRHGSGTQSLAVICLFDAFLKSRLQEDYGEYAEPLLAMEEPEAHLHPSAVKSVGEMLKKFSGQKLISTHSGDLMASVPLQKIRRLSRNNGEISAHRIKEGSLSQDEINKLDYHVRMTRGSLLFSKCWLLVEGETEATLMPGCAHAMGYDLYADGVSCIEFSQIGVEKFIKLADQLGINWFVLVDNDKEGKKYKRTAVSQLDGREANNHIQLLEHGTMEIFLCMEGFGDIYESGIAAQMKNEVAANKGTLEYWRQVSKAQSKNSKPKNSIAVVEQMVTGGADVPELLRGVIEQARKLAQSNY